MTTLQIHGKHFKTFIPEKEVLAAVERIAQQINQDYEGKNPLLIGVLNGSFMFISDLFKNLTIEAEIAFVRLKSYEGMKSSGEVITALGLDIDLKGRDIILVEDIVDTGKTLHDFLPVIKNLQPASLRIATLLHKPDARKYSFDLDYCCFTIPNVFVLGYGLDYDGLGRNTRDLLQLEETV
jgi:hypoxanthine phosphoribosyltransferase